MQRAPSSCSPPRGVAADCAAQRAAEAISHSPPHSAKFVLGRAPRRPPTAFAARRERRFLSESRYSLFKRSMPTGFGGEAGSKRRYASLRCGRLRPARPVGSQEHSPKHSQQVQPKARPSSPPRVRLTAAPLSLRRVSARLARFILFRLAAEIVESLL